MGVAVGLRGWPGLRGREATAPEWERRDMGPRDLHAARPGGVP